MKKWTVFSHINVPHGITNKHGGFSQNHFASMNTAFYGEDDFFVVMKNLKEVISWLDKPVKAIFASRQIHGACIQCVDDERTWSTFTKFDTCHSVLEGVDLYVVENCDGLVTKREDVLLMTYYADCVPLILWDPILKIIGTAHSGWRGTTLEISKKLVNTFVNDYGSEIKHLKAGIGHAAGPCCYEVGQEVYDAFTKVFTEDLCENFFYKRGDKYHVDLKQAIALQWLSVGISKTQIEVETDCTICTQASGKYVYHSHRRDGFKRGSMSAFISL